MRTNLFVYFTLDAQQRNHRMVWISAARLNTMWKSAILVELQYRIVIRPNTNIRFF